MSDRDRVESAVFAVRMRVSECARGMGAWSVGRERQAVEQHLAFAAHSGEAGRSELEAELPEWRRIEVLMSGSDGRYDPARDLEAVAAVAELDRIEQAAREARHAVERAEQEAQERALRRAEVLLRLAAAGALDDELVGVGDPAVWSAFRRRSPAAVARVDAWMAHADGLHENDMDFRHPCHSR